MNPGREFQEIGVGKLFHVNGNDYMKQSSRTAKMLRNGRVFYFRKTEIVHIEVVDLLV
jgi:hypothetical protein